MTGETGTQGSEFPIFKSGEGAFDRAKYEEQDKERIISNGIIPSSTDEVIKEANKFYDESLQKNIRSLDPAYDPNIIYYSKAYSDGGVNKNKIREEIEKGEAIDGKEIYQMSKGAAENKIENAQKLKTGNVTQIVENLGIKTIKDYENYNAIKEEFDSKIKNEDAKFDSLLNKFSSILSHFNKDEGALNTQKDEILYTTENNAIISAFAKILELEGFNSKNVLDMSKSYENNLQKLINKSDKLSIESIKTTSEPESKEIPSKEITEEKKLAEKLQETTSTETTTSGSTNSFTSTESTNKIESIESVGNSTSINNSQGLTGPASSTTENNLVNPKESTVTTGTIKNTEEKLEKNAQTRLEDLIDNLLGINLNPPGATGSEEKNEIKLEEKSEPKTETEKTIEKKAERIFGFNNYDTESTEGNKLKSEVKSLETKLVTKNQEKKAPVNETLTGTKSKIETKTQNLSSVITPTDKAKNEEVVNNDINNSSISSTSSTSSMNDKQSENNQSTETQKTEIINNEKKSEENNKNRENENKEMIDTMKTIASLLMQLNSTMQNPLIVTPTNKKFQ